MPREATDEELVEIGKWTTWALRQPNALEIFQKQGARCPHGPVCQDCLDEMRTRVAQIVNGQEPAEG
jgi:hypothetical protein